MAVAGTITGPHDGTPDHDNVYHQYLLTSNNNDCIDGASSSYAGTPGGHPEIGLWAKQAGQEIQRHTTTGEPSGVPWSEQEWDLESVDTPVTYERRRLT